jgi:hypothetical protein
MASHGDVSLIVSVRVDEEYMLMSAIDEARRLSDAWDKLPGWLRFLCGHAVNHRAERLGRKIAALDLKAKENNGIVERAFSGE